MEIDGSANWEVAIACDVRLGQYFGRDQPYEGYGVEVNEDAAIEQLHASTTNSFIHRRFGEQPSFHPILLKAGVSKVVEATNGNLVFETGGIKTQFSEDLKPEKTEITIAVDKPVSSRWSPDQPCLVKRSLRDDDEIQKSTRHEFKHLTDFCNKKVLLLEASYQKFTGQSSPNVNLRGCNSWLLGKLGTFAYSMWVVSQAKGKAGFVDSQAIQRKSPIEASAYKASETEGSQSQVVSILKLANVEAELQSRRRNEAVIETQYPELISKAA